MAGSATPDSRYTPPQPSEVEVSLFGPGYGECVVVHLGAGEWLVVDSCQWRKGEGGEYEQAAPVAYLRRLGVDIASQVKMVVASHWHDDHIRGLSGVVEAAMGASFFCAAALTREEFLTLVFAHEPGAMMKSSGIREFARVLEVGKERMRWAGESKRLYQRSPRAEDAAVEVWSLAPTDATLTAALTQFAGLLSEQYQQGALRRLPVVQPNNAAVVLWIKVGRRMILLGADLEEAGSLRGWSAILAAAGRPQGAASLFKVPHHGSENAHHPGVWGEMLSGQPVAVLTPFNLGKVHLPKRSDVERILEQAGEAHVTSRPRPAAAPKRSGALARSLRESTEYIRAAEPPIGQVRARAAASANDVSDWTIERFDAAIPLESLL